MISHHRSVFAVATDAQVDQVDELVRAAVAQEQSLSAARITVTGVAVQDDGQGRRVFLGSTFDSATHPELSPRQHREFVETTLQAVLDRIAHTDRLNPYEHSLSNGASA